MGFQKTNPQDSRIEVPAVFRVDGKALCARGGRTLPGCRSEVVLYTLLVIIASRRHMNFAIVEAALGWDHPSPGMVCTRVIPVQAGTQGTI